MVYVFRYFRATVYAGRLTYEAPGFTEFWHEELTEQRQYGEWVADRRYRVFEMRTILFPTVTGPATIAPTVFNLPRAFRTRIQFTSDTVSLDVRPLPPGAPDNFSGAGRSTSRSSRFMRAPRRASWRGEVAGRGWRCRTASFKAGSR